MAAPHSTAELECCKLVFEILFEMSFSVWKICKFTLMKIDKTFILEIAKFYVNTWLVFLTFYISYKLAVKQIDG